MSFLTLRPILSLKTYPSKTPSDLETGAIKVPVEVPLEAPVEAPAVSFWRKIFFRGKGQPSTLSSRTSEIEANIVRNLEKFASMEVSNIYALLPPSRPTGLFADEAALALSTHGPNVLSASAPVGALVLLTRAVINPFNFLLVILAVVSIATQDYATFSIMMLMVVISSGLRFWQEHKSVMKASKLVSMVHSMVRVFRHPGTAIEAAEDVKDENEIEIEKRDVVPGDIVVLTSGDMFPGDAVLLQSNALLVGQSALTGEVMPVEKKPFSLHHPTKITSASDLISSPNICLAGTSVASGSCQALIVATGDDTYIASIAQALSARRPKNAFQIGIRQVSFLLLSFMAVMTPIVLIIKGTTSGHWRDAFLFCISVAVGLTPELLPMIVTSNLALSAVRMSGKKVIVKQLEAIQNLGATTVLCSDKTGTLTLDQVELYSSVDGSGAPFLLPLRLAYLNAYFQTGSRNLLDASILNCPEKFASYGGQGGTIEALKHDWIKVAELPFDSSRRLLSVVVTQAGGSEKQLMVTKGAVEEVLERCNKMYDVASDGDLSPIDRSKFLDKDTRAIFLRTAEDLNSEGLRLVAVASKPIVLYEDMELSSDDESDLVFAGFLAFLDPPKPDAGEAITQLKGLGVQVLVLTGDASTVAAKVATDLGILDNVSSKTEYSTTPTANGVITGSALTALSADQAKFDAAVLENVVFAKLSPYLKLQIVEALRRQGRTVAFLGDGVNDAMALRGADIGISVDSGTEIAKDAADVILLEKSLAVIADGVLLGRVTFVNTLKYIKMAASSNFGNVFSILAASAWLPYDPMSPLQILVQNLLYDFSQASIPWDNIDPESIREPRRWEAKSIMRFMIVFGPTSSVFDICIFSLNWFKYGIRTSDSPLVGLAQTHWFLEGLLTQVLIVYCLRTAKIPFIQSSPSIAVIMATATVAGLGIALPFVPVLNHVFGMVRPDLVYAGYLCAILAAYIILVQTVKSLYLIFLREWI